MLQTLSQVLDQFSVRAIDTPYAPEQNSMLDTPISCGAFFSCAPLEKYLPCFGLEERFQDAVQNRRKSLGTEKFDADLASLQSRLRSLRPEQPQTTPPDEAKRALLSLLRLEKKELQTRLNALNERATREAGWEICPRGGLERQKVLEFQDFLLVQGERDICSLLPHLDTTRFLSWKNAPLFTYRIAELAKRIKEGGTVAVTGGPCLFGKNEVDIQILFQDGKSVTLDYSSGRNYIDNNACQGECGIEQLLVKHGAEVEEIRFQNQKMQLTSQEFESLYMLFAIADSFGPGTPLAIPIPDFSYLKYLDALLSALSPALREKTETAYIQVLDEICDLYLSLIARLQREFPHVKAFTLHRRNAADCRRFEESRDPFYRGKHLLRTMTGNALRVESILDYVSMPALPYYFGGSTHILHVDSLDEGNSMHKCAQAHKGLLQFYGLFYPERISRDSENTIFYANREHKEYGIET